MPISTENQARYPIDWPFLSYNIIMRRAGRRCECHGQCAGVNTHLDPGDGRCRNRHGEPRWRGKPWQRPVILSLAHLDRDPGTRDLERLVVFCEGCHLRFDARQHWATRRRNHERRAGLIPLPGFELIG